MKTNIIKYLLTGIFGMFLILTGCTDLLSNDPAGAGSSLVKIQVTSPNSSDSIGYTGEEIKYSVSGGSGVNFVELHIDGKFHSIYFAGSDGAAPKITFSADQSKIGTKFNYFLVYFDKNGGSATSTKMENVIISDIRIVPPPPYNFTLTRLSSSNSVNLAWKDSSIGITGFEIWRRAGFTGAYAKYLEAAPTSFNINDNNSPETAIYYYKIRAVNKAGASEFSNEINSQNVGSSSVAFFPPTSLQGTNLAGPKVSLTWTDNSSNENYFKIERRNDWSTFTEVARVAGNTTQYTDSANGLTLGLQYIYRIKAVSNSDSSWSNEAKVYTSQ